MPLRLILNADDFGLTLGINRAIAELHRAGVLTSATLMATGPAFEDAVTLALALPTLGVGCHIVLVDGTPVSPPGEIPTLLGPDRQTFRPSPATFLRDLLLQRIDPNDIAHEAAAQLTKLRRAGIVVTHADTHKHLHLFPAVTRALVQYRITPALRNPFEPVFARRLPHSSVRRRVELACLSYLQPAFQQLAKGVLTTDGTVGIAATGKLNAHTLRELLRILPSEGTFELCCHPGYDDLDLHSLRTRLRHEREVEREALLSEVPQTLLLPQAPVLIHYGNL